MTYEVYQVLFHMALRRANNNWARYTDTQCARYARNAEWMMRLDAAWLERWMLEDAVYTYQTTIECPYE